MEKLRKRNGNQFRADKTGMSLFTWNAKYSVGHAQIDQQHRGLFIAADELHAAMLGGCGKHVIAGTLGKLLDYTREHFRAEEALMQSSKYLQFHEHKAEHDSFTRQVVELKQGLDRGETAVSVDTAIAQHIASSSVGPSDTRPAGCLTANLPHNRDL